MKFNLLKTMLVAFGMVAGTSVATADDINATLVHTAGAQWGSNTPAHTVDAAKEHFNLDAGSGWAGAAFAEFSFDIPEGHTITSATLTWSYYQNNSSKYTSDIYYLNQGITIDYTEFEASTDVVQYNGEKTWIVKTESYQGTKNTGQLHTGIETDVTDAVKNISESGQNFIIFQWTNNNGSGDLVGKGAEANAPILVITTANASTMTTYTVKFTDAAGTELKEAATYDVAIGDEATASETDMAAFKTEDGKKYVYASGNETITAVKDATENVITLVFNEAAIWSYTINYVDGSGNTLGSKEGTNFEQETFEVAYPAYFEADGTIYKSSKLSSDGKGYYFPITLSEDNLTKDVKFSASNAKNVVYFSEAEDIEGLTLTNNNNTFIRSSNGASAYAKDGDVVFTTLPAGKYKLTTIICDASKSAGSVWHFKAGDDVVFEYTANSVNWAEGTSEEFTLYADTEISLGQGGGSNVGVDLIYIQKTGEATIAASVDATGFSTFCPTVGVSFAGVENVEAYKAAVDVAEGVVNLTKVETVAAGEGVLLRSVEGGAANVELTLAADAEANAGNEFIGVTEDIPALATDADGKTNYILNKGSLGVGFYLAAGQKVASGKAYLAVDGVSAAKNLKVAFGGDTTGISEINATKTDGAFYSVSGVRVANPTKGLYIMNGKKVIVK